MKITLLFGVACTLLTSCSMRTTTNTAKTLDIYGAGVIQKPVLTNLKVNPQKITSTYSGSGSKDLEYHKSQAIAQAMGENKADVIIEPAYEVVSNSTSVKITTTGYAGTYNNFRQMTGADTSLLVNAGIMSYNDSRDEAPEHVAEKKKAKGLLLALVLLGLAAGVSAGLGTF